MTGFERFLMPLLDELRRDGWTIEPPRQGRTIALTAPRGLNPDETIAVYRDGAPVPTAEYEIVHPMQRNALPGVLVADADPKADYTLEIVRAGR